MTLLRLGLTVFLGFCLVAASLRVVAARRQPDLFKRRVLVFAGVAAGSVAVNLIALRYLR